MREGETERDRGLESEIGRRERNTDDMRRCLANRIPCHLVQSVGIVAVFDAIVRGKRSKTEEGIEDED